MSRLLIKKQWFISSKSQNIRNYYDIHQQLGSGSTGKVYLARDRTTNTPRAIKLLHKNRISQYTSFCNQIQILRHLDHPNIVKIIQTFQSDRHCYLVLQFCSGGNLFDRILKQKYLSQYQAALIMKSLFSAVGYCHSLGVCHRDLKPQNCLLIDEMALSDIKLIDFGLSQVLQQDQVMHSVSGTAYFIAPEVLTGNYTKEVDCWSLGVILYIMLSGIPPFGGSSNQEILSNVYNGYFDFKPRAFRYVSNAVKDLIARLLIIDPQLRMTAKAALVHPWVTQHVPVSREPLPQIIFQGLSGFIQAQQLKRATLILIASKLSEKDLNNLKTIFQSIDVNSDGFLSRIQLYQGLKQTGKALETSEFQALCSVLDQNQNGRIDYTEFLGACLYNQVYAEQGYLKAAFQYFDVDNSGFIQAHQIREILKGDDIQMSIDQGRTEEIIREADKNGDGMIDYVEFLDMMSHMNQSQLILCS